MSETRPDAFECAAPANPTGLASCRAAMEASALYQSLPVRLRFATDLALDELATNTIKYGGCADSLFHFRLAYSEGALRIEYSDRGTPFDPWQHREEPSLDSIDDTRIGGRGLIMMRELSSSRDYERRQEMNVVTLTVRAEPEP